MKQKLVLLLGFAMCLHVYAQSPITNGPDWTVTNISANHAFNYPWELTYGPDNNLWLTERVGEKISKYNIGTGAITTMIDLGAKVANSTQGGLLGMAIHPDLYNNINTSTNNYVYTAYTYEDNGHKVRLVRLVYNHAAGTLTEDTSLNANGAILEGLPGSSDHNSGRMTIGPDLKIYYTVGDQGANQFGYSCDPILSQVMPTSVTDYAHYAGKTLRINLDGSVPSDNPVFNGVQSHVNTYGHRNCQGVVFAQDGTLYASEQGPKTDDEINILSGGMNYGWPEIAGYYDNLAYTYCNWSSLEDACNAGAFSDHNCPSGAETATEFESYPSGAPANFQPPIGTYGSTIPSDPSGDWGTWPTPAVSSIDIHENGNIPGWGRSLLITSLKKGTIYRAKLTPDGADIVGDSYEEFHSSIDRYRDIAISPDGLTIYAITDNGGGTSGPSSDNVVTNLSNPGLIMKIEYVGAVVSNGPVANCQDITVSLDGTGNATITANDINNGSTGGSAGIDTIVLDRYTFSCEDTDQVQTVWLTVTDNDGNESRCTASVTVAPNSNPDPISAPVLDDIVSNCAITVQAPTVTSNGCVDITATTTDDTTFESGESGSITWSFNDNGNIVTASQNVTVNAFSVPQNIIVTPGATSASVTWYEIEGVTFDVRYRELGSFTWIDETTSTNEIEIIGLNMLTDYEFQVRSNCGSAQSAYSLTTFFTTTDINYCDAYGIINGDNHHITRVILEDINNPSGGSTYSDYTATTPASLLVDQTYTITIEKSTPPDSWKTAGFSVWIDYNIDGDFDDPGERVAGTNAGSNLSAYNQTSRSFSFTLPSSVVSGTSRMRVSMMQYYTPQDACGIVNNDGNSSEVEDYAITLIDNTLSVPQNELIDFAVFPNPIKNQITVKLPSNMHFNKLQVSLFDIQGRIIKNQDLDNSQTEIVFNDLSRLNSGVYFIKITSESKQLLSKKLIKI